MLQFPPGGKGGAVCCMKVMCEASKWSRNFCREEFVGMCEAPGLSTVLSFFTKTLPRKVNTTSKFDKSLSLRRFFRI